MVQEVRSILFTAEECRAAIMHLLMMRLAVHQTNQVTRVELQGPKVSALVTVSTGKSSAQHTMDSAELMSAVLLFCRKAGIPLSTWSHKRLSILADCLALTTSINLQSTAPTIDNGTIVHALAGPDLALMHTT